MKARLAVSFVAGLAIALGASAAGAQSKQECADAYTAAQVARRDKKLKDARDKLVVCANASCPGALKKDCGPWLAEVEAELPTLSVKPVDETGRVVGAATIAVDGASVARDGDVATVRVDPGEHVVRVEAPGKNIAEQRVSLSAGAPRRELTVRLDRADPTGPIAAPSKPEPASSPSRPVPALSYVLGGVGVAGIGAFAVLGVLGSSRKSDLDDQKCKPNCKASDVSAIKTDYNAADVALGVGGAALVGAVIVFLLRPDAEAEKPAETTSWSALPHRGGGSFVVRF